MTTTTKRRLTVDEAVRILVDCAPPLSDEQRERLARILRPTAVAEVTMSIARGRVL